jgi:hypothetical protein
MRIMLEEDLAGCRDLDEVQAQAQRTLGELKDEGYSIRYVAGPISADGDEHIQRNLNALVAARTRVMHQVGERALVFTAPFIFTPEVYGALNIFTQPRDEREAAMQRFWDTLIGSGVVDGIYFADGWQRSPGARRERQTAEAVGVPVYDIDTMAN